MGRQELGIKHAEQLDMRAKAAVGAILDLDMAARPEETTDEMRAEARTEIKADIERIVRERSVSEDEALIVLTEETILSGIKEAQVNYGKDI